MWLWSQAKKLAAAWRWVNLQQLYTPVANLSSKPQGRVQLVRRRRDGELCVLKIVSRPELHGCTAHWSEEHALHRLQHEHIVRRGPSGRTRCGQRWIELEYVEGATLEGRLSGPWGLEPQLLPRCRSAQERFTVLEHIRQIAAALSYMHWHQWLHGDLSPHNVIVRSQTNQAVLIDFEHARLLTSGQRPAPPRQHSLAYASPAELAGLPTTFPCELYSLGLIALEQIAGRLPADRSPGSVQATLAEALARQGDAVSETAAALLSRCLSRALAPDPADRQQSAAQFAAELGEVQSAG